MAGFPSRILGPESFSVPPVYCSPNVTRLHIGVLVTQPQLQGMNVTSPCGSCEGRGVKQKFGNTDARLTCNGFVIAKVMSGSLFVRKGWARKVTQTSCHVRRVPINRCGKCLQTIHVELRPTSRCGLSLGKG